MNPDAVVIGGGPAGLAAAIGLARQGVPTCLIERRRYPIDKACGEGLMPNGVRLLEQLGVAPADLHQLGRRLEGIRYFGADATAAAGFVGGAGLGLRRVDLSALLVWLARRYTCLDVVSGFPATVRRRPGGGCDVHVDGEVLSPRLVIIADGLGSPTARSLGMASVKRRPFRWGARQHFGGPAWSDHVEVHFAPGCEAYVTPLRDGVNVAVLWEAEHADWPAGEQVIDSAITRFPRLTRQLEGRERLDRPSAAGPFSRRVAERADDGVVVIGDAAGYVDPLTGEGVGLALVQAALLEDLVAKPLARQESTGPVPRGALMSFVASVDRATRPNRQLTTILLRLSRRPALVEHVIRALDEDPMLFRHCLAANMGERAVWRLPVRSLVRLPRVLARRAAWGS